MNMNEFGPQIQLRRKKMGMTQATLAKSNRMSRATISNLENGKLPELGLRKFLALCATLGLTIELKEANPRPTLRDLVKENEADKYPNPETHAAMIEADSIANKHKARFAKTAQIKRMENSS
jgi:HTH-type transcriptional regulator/antitoxin HipB